MAEASYNIANVGRISISVPSDKVLALSRMDDRTVASVVRTSASGLASITRTRAPYRYGALQSGIIVNPKAERSATPGKVVYDVVFDAAMNDTFVKMSKAGKRYYYPASQEYGFRIGRGKKKPGLYYMRNTAIEYFPTHTEAVAAAVGQILEEL